MFETILQPIWPFYAIIRLLVIFADMVLFFVAVFAAVELFSYRPRFVYDPRKSARKRIKKSPAVVTRENWDKIHDWLGAGTPEAVRMAIIEADGLVDGVLKRRGYEGDTFADRLSKFSPETTSTLDRVWNAHRLRNDVVHTAGFIVSADRAKKALDDYEAFLKEIEAI